MENFGLNSAKSYIGKNVNLHMKDGSVIVNVYLKRIRKNDFGTSNVLEYSPFGNNKISSIPLKNIAWAEMLNMNFMQRSG
jgi:hypothetical protein